ncbi:MAG: hypothetical protein HKM93_05255 [Desulfobacteraceae bacterium]|nr:hypothetical protein [Desulfobacteraceae bacterium]
MTPDELKNYMATHHESDFLLVDVRQPEEYGKEHIPGAKLCPIMTYVAGLYEQPGDRDLIFYCQSGGRSAAAAALAIEEKVTTRDVHYLTGGIEAWEDRTLPDFPKISIFDLSGTQEELLRTAMDLEKGALRYYDHVAKRFAGKSFAGVFSRLAEAENAHARTVYDVWCRMVDEPPPFETIFQELKGHILEGGEDLKKMLKRVISIKSDTCMILIELGLLIENAALDLYKAMADQTVDRHTKKAFLAIAQAEKAHMKILLGQIEKCAQT